MLIICIKNQYENDIHLSPPPYSSAFILRFISSAPVAKVLNSVFLKINTPCFLLMHP